MANLQGCLWYSFNSNVVSISTGWYNDQRYQTLTPLTNGIATIYAYDWNEHGKRGECTVYVGGAPVTGITLDCSKKVITLYESEQLVATVFPANALNKGVTWSSSNKNIAEVDEHGWVTANRAGTTTIIATTEEGDFIARCKVTVDRRPKVFVKKDVNYSNLDNTYFNIIFPDGKIWRNIGLDLSNRQDNYGSVIFPDMTQENYDYLIPEEQRYIDNIKNTFTVEQIAYIYLFDPIGIEYYMRTNACDDKGTVSDDVLTFKDAVYEAIFGTAERSSGKFYFTIVNGEPRYGTYSDSSRTSVYSNAEVLFGFHNIIEWNLIEFIKLVLEGLFGEFLDDSIAGNIFEAYQILFHAGGILGACSDKVTSYITDYAQNKGENKIEEYLMKKYGEAFVKKTKLPVHWGITLVTILVDSAISAFNIPNPQDITIYNRINTQSEFLTILEGFDSEVTMEDIINQVNQN